ncbi:MAG: 50S ribosomal protein L24 [Flavobacteriaceae bacterium]|nr:50S ribosomal protein L24 [Flavobacteriaceae bacterium]MCY4268233.1 50S ribosomal protein L24 [Flavobacteriaceae bacterium]MCY4300052.1 50S ribosomal protein L24 [Flavobacteriaceae bacterium]
MSRKIKIKKGDVVRVIAGEHKGKQGTIMKIKTKANKAIVGGVNMVKRHTKPSKENAQGGIIEKEAPIHVSNLSLISKGETTRIGYRLEGKQKVRYALKTSEPI